MTSKITYIHKYIIYMKYRLQTWTIQLFMFIKNNFNSLTLNRKRRKEKISTFIHNNHTKLLISCPVLSCPVLSTMIMVILYIKISYLYSSSLLKANIVFLAYMIHSVYQYSQQGKCSIR